jgi:hypothetical protein
MSNDKELSRSDLPQNLFAEMSNMIHTFSTSLIKVSVDRNGKENIALIGSGTFVTVGNINGILTADHVVKLLDNPLGSPKSLGLAIQKYAHKYTIDREYLKIYRIARGNVDSEGPDLAFISIPPAKLGTIRAEKSFYNLQRNRDRMLSSPPEPNLGVWAICGAPDIETTDEKPTQAFIEVKKYHSFCFFGGISRIYDVEKFDYLEIEANDDCDPDIPESFGGVSGGGVWQVPLVRTSNGVMKPQEYLLSGVAFYQTKKSGSLRSIKCHARKSVYDAAYRAIEEIS